MNLKDFIAKYKGKKVEYHSYGTGALYQCVDLVNQYIKEVLNLTPIIGTDAGDFATKFDKAQFNYIKNSPTGVPNEGDITIWDKRAGGGAGHVAIFIEGNDKRFTSFDQNWNSATCQVTEHTYKYVSGWLQPINKLPQTMKPTEKLPEAFYQIKEAKELIKRKLITAKDAFDTILAKFVATSDVLEKQKVHFDKETNALIDEKEVLQDKLEGVTQDLNARNSYITELEAKVDRLNSIISNQPTSAKGEINSKDIVKWLKNTGWYAILPLVITYLTVLQTNIPKEYAVIAVPLIATGIDFIKKLMTDNK